MITLDEQAQVQKWLDDEKNGEQFPVDFNIAWQMAGYSRKDHAKRRIETDLTLGIDFAFLKSGEWTQQGRSSDLIQLTCDGFKHFCLLAKTEKGRAIRQYFIEAEKLIKDKMIPTCQVMAQRIEKLETELAQKQQTNSNHFFVLGEMDYLCLCFKRGENFIRLFETTDESIDHICTALNAVTQSFSSSHKLLLTERFMRI